MTAAPKFLLLLCFFFTIYNSCATVKAKDIDKGENRVGMEQKKYKMSPSKDNLRFLYYRIESSMNSPVSLITYYVKDEKGKIIKGEEKITAEKIYWKSNRTLAYVPYREVIKQQTTIGENSDNEIIIKIN